MIPKNGPDQPGIPRNPGARRRAPGGLPVSPPQMGGGIPKKQGIPINKPAGIPKDSDEGLPELELPAIYPDASSQYDFGSNSSKLSKVSEPIVNKYDDDDDTFSSVPIEEQIEEAEKENYDLDDESEEANSYSKSEEQTSSTRQQELDEEADKESEDLEQKEIEKEALAKKNRKTSKKKSSDEEQDTFIDKKNLQLKPFGGKKKIKVNEFDKRKNAKTNANIIRYTTLGLLGLILALGIKGNIFPPDTLSEEDASIIAANTVGMTDFPIDQGRGFAVDFMQAYLTSNTDSVSDTVLGYFYNGTMSAEDYPNRYMSSDFKQRILYGPTVYSSKALTDHSASFVIGALVESSTKDKKPPTDGSAGHWEFFNVNVYYDAASGGMSITPDSPSVVPSADILAQRDVPEADVVGTGQVDEALTEELQSVVYGFLKGYAVTTPTDHSALDQYIVSDATSELKRGLNNQYAFSGSEIENSVEYEAYPTENPGEVKVKAVVHWVNNLGGSENNIRSEYVSNYIITLEKQSNEKYLISKFAPEYFVAYDSLENK